MKLVSKNFSDIVTFTRASSGTSFRPVSYGPELVSNGDFSVGTTGWTLDQATVSSGVASIASVAAGVGVVQQVVSLIVGRTYKCSFSVSSLTSAGGGLSIRIGGTDSTVVTASGSYSFNIVYDGTSPVAMVRTRLATVTAQFDNISVREVILDRAGDPIQLFESPTNVPRIDYDPVTGACKGLLIEESRTNLLPSSSDFTSGVVGWANNSNWSYISRQSNQLTELGLSFSSIGITSTGQSAWMSSDSVAGTVGEAFTVSILAKAKSVSNHYALSIRGNTYPRRVDAVFNLLTGAVVYSGGNTWTGAQARSTNLGNGVWRLELTGINQNAENVVMFHGPCDATGASAWEGGRSTLCDAYITAAQFERGSFATSFIPTAGATVTRASDVAAINTINPWFNQFESTFFIEAAASGWTDQTADFLLLGVVSSGASTAKGIGRYSGGTLQTHDGTAYRVFPNGSYSTGAIFKLALSQTTGISASGAVNGTVGAIATDGDVFDGITSLRVGSSNGENKIWCGHIRQIRYIPKRLTDSELQALTS